MQGVESGCDLGEVESDREMVLSQDGGGWVVTGGPRTLFWPGGDTIYNHLTIRNLKSSTYSSCTRVIHLYPAALLVVIV